MGYNHWLNVAITLISVLSGSTELNEESSLENAVIWSFQLFIREIGAKIFSPDFPLSMLVNRIA